ncbi:unnamed protein product [Bemisia tabaci]|uniref:Transmembrane protein 231 n=1 Tax=Bemisia tabaci TaxID=7038 RepID=A0A9P0ALL0_BEMTA|nr:PREDICTED: transmembrane protein 231-like [Bemisia tabaci]CAH0393075.1 unnamed protein product [Bemisia tabaci]
MGFYIAHSEPATIKYRSSYCSKASMTIVITTVLTIVFPFLLSYRSHGFWLKHDTYREHPLIRFKYEYLLFLETQNFDSPIICSSIASIAQTEIDLMRCPLLTVHEADLNLDRIYDQLDFEVTAVLRDNETVYSATLLLLFDFKITNHCWLQMETLGWTTSETSLPSSRLDIIGDLVVSQKQPLPCHGRDVRYNESIMVSTTEDTYELPFILRNYATRNVTTHLTNLHRIWTHVQTPETSFVVSATIFYPEVTILYKPGFWQVIKFAWVQYFAVAVIFVFIARKVRRFIFTNHLVQTIKATPWEKPHYL